MTEAMKDAKTARLYRWADMEQEQVNPGMKRRLLSGAHIMVSEMHFADGTVVPHHSHHNEQVTSVLSGTIRFYLGENKQEVIEVGPGEVLVIPPHLPHEAHMIGDVIEFDTFSPPRQDWLDGSDSYLRR